MYPKTSDKKYRDKQKDRQIDTHTYIQTDRQIDKQTDNHTLFTKCFQIPPIKISYSAQNILGIIENGPFLSS